MIKALKILLWFVLGFLFLLAVLLATLPMSVPPIVQRLAQDYGIELSIGKLGVDWSRGRISINDVSVVAIDSGSDPLLLGRLVADLGVRQLLESRTLVVDEIEVSNTDLPLLLELDEGNQLQRLLVAGIDPAAFEAGQAEDKKEVEDQEATASFEGWQKIGIRNFTIDAQLIRAGSELALPVEVARIDIGALSLAEPNIKTPVGVALVANQAALKFSGDVAALAPGREGHVALKLDAVKLENWQKLLDFLQIELGPVGGASGELALTSNLEWWLAGERNFLTMKNTELSADDLAITLLGEQADQAGMDFKGVLRTQVEELKLQTSPFNYRLANIALQSQSFAIEDAALDPPFDFNFNELFLQADQLDSQQPEQPISASLKTGIGRYGKLDLQAAGSLLSENANGSIKLEAEQINLSSFSGFAKNALGKHIDKGALDMTYDATIAQGQLDSKAKIEAHQLSLSGDYGANSNMVEELGMPVNAALNLLRDKDDTVRLSVPIKSDLRDPQIKIGNIVNKALMNGVKTAVFTQFGPLMALSALDKARSLADGLKLKPVEFTSLQTEINLSDDEIRERLAAIAKLLDSRPKIRLNVCGYSYQREIMAGTESSGQSLSEQTRAEEAGQHEQADVQPVLSEDQRKQLHDLATGRAEAIKDELIGRKIDGKRLILCAPEVGSDSDGMPRVEFSL